MDPVQLQTLLTWAAVGPDRARRRRGGPDRPARGAGRRAAPGAAVRSGTVVQHRRRRSRHGAWRAWSAGVKRLGDRMAIQDPAQLSTIRARLIQAGWFSREAVAVYLGAKAVALLLATVATVLTVPWALSGGGGMGAILLAGGPSRRRRCMGPDQVIKARRRKLELEYMDGFPDLLDLLVASVEAGLSLDAAVSRVGEELSRRYVHLGEHLRFLTLELRAGRSRKEAWSSFAERLAIDDARALATMLRQSEEMGTSLGDTLTVFSEDMRAKRMLRAEEKAMSLPAKLMVPLILFIFPCLMGVLIMPAAFRISQTLMAN
jgi:tight adherence protein C